MSNLNNAISSVAGVVGKCVGGNHFPRGPLPILPASAVLPVVLVGGLAAYAARSLVGRLFD